MKDKVDLLIQLLFDSSASISDRDDAAIDLGNFDDDRVLNALISFATNSEVEDSIMDVCGESIARIWVKRKQFDAEAYKKLHPYAKHEAQGYIKENSPEWLIEI